MKLEGTTEMKRRSVMMPVSMLWNSNLVWAPVIWPVEKQTVCKAEEEVQRNWFVHFGRATLQQMAPKMTQVTTCLPLWRCQQTVAGFCPVAPPSQCATRCHSASAPQTASLVPCLSQRVGKQGMGLKIINNTKGNTVSLTPAHARWHNFFFFYTAGDNRRGENLLAWQRLHSTWYKRS